MKRIQIIFISILMVLVSCESKKSIQPFWPNHKSPEIIGKRLIQEFLKHEEFKIADSYGFTAIYYAEACAAFGVARMANVLKDKQTLSILSEKYRRVITDSIPNTANHVDANVYGILPFELYKHTKEKAFYQQAIYLADVQWENPRSDGLSNQTRFWIDDIWMIGSLQTQAYRATGNNIYIERAALQIDAYLKRLQQPNGLFHHGPGIPFFWGRGNGWVAAGLSELISELPKENPHYNSIVDGYKKMMDALVQNQAEDGMWRQLIDEEISWKETSGTAMFGYALTQGVKSGILQQDKYTTAYQKAWLALCNYVDEEGRLTEVCIGTGQQNDIDYYLNRPRTIGDNHGQAPLLWFAWALISK